MRSLKEAASGPAGSGGRRLGSGYRGSPTSVLTHPTLPLTSVQSFHPLSSEFTLPHHQTTAHAEACGWREGVGGWAEKVPGCNPEPPTLGKKKGL